MVGRGLPHVRSVPGPTPPEHLQPPSCSARARLVRCEHLDTRMISLTKTSAVRPKRQPTSQPERRPDNKNSTGLAEPQWQRRCPEEWLAPPAHHHSCVLRRRSRGRACRSGVVRGHAAASGWRQGADGARSPRPLRSAAQGARRSEYGALRARRRRPGRPRDTGAHPATHLSVQLSREQRVRCGHDERRRVVSDRRRRTLPVRISHPRD